MPALRDRRGFSLVEILVTVSIMAVLIAITLPALQSVRESARRAMCSQRIGTMARGMASFCSRKDRLPAAQGLMELTQPDSSYSRRTVSWHTQILPYLDRPDLATALAANNGWTDRLSYQELHNSSSSFWVDSWMCPSAELSLKICGQLHYSANCGTGTSRNDGVLVSTDYAPAPLPTGTPVPRPPYPSASAGPASMALADVRDGDGLANTMILAETTRQKLDGANDIRFIAWNLELTRLLGPNVSPAYNGWPLGFTFVRANRLYWGAVASNFITDLPYVGIVTVGSNPPAQPIRTTSRSAGSYNLYTPFSHHQGGANVAFCDGSVRFVRDSLPTHIYAHMVTSRSVFNGTTYETNSNLARTWLSASSAPMPYDFSANDLAE